MNWPAYPEYKQSGVDWLGELPAHWGTKPLWSMFTRIKNTGFPDEEMLSVYREHGVVIKDSRDDNLNKTAEDRNIYQLVGPGWLVTNRMKAWQGSVGISSHRGIVSGHYICFRPDHDAVDAYLNQLFRSSRYVAGYQTLSRGVRPGQAEIDNDQYRSMPVVVPPDEEQSAIARFLDAETSKIDALIGKQEQLIATLREERAAVISRNADLVGRRVPNLGLLLDGLKDGTHGSFSRVDVLGGYPLLGARNIVGSRVILDGAESHISEADHIEIVSNGFPRKGDVLLVIVGATIGKTAVYDKESPMSFQRSVAFLRPGCRLDTDFLWYQIQSARFQDELRLRSKTSAQPGIYLGDVAAIPVYLPPLDEQRRIAAYLDERMRKIDALIDKSERIIELVHEYRSALITDAVTGKVDVRGAV